MDNWLTVESVCAEKIGKFTGEELSFDVGGLTVVYGDNEAGKSTMADLIVWLLTIEGFEQGLKDGVSEEETLLRFGKVGEEVSGKLKGFIGEKKFTIDASCKIAEKGVGKSPYFSGSLSVNNSIEDIENPDKWRYLSGVSKEDFDRTYFLKGVELHERNEAVHQLEELVDGTDGFSIPTIKEKLTDLAAEQLSKKGKGRQITGGEYLSKVETEIGVENKKINALKEDITKLSLMEKELKGLQEELDDVKAKLSEREKVIQELVRAPDVLDDLLTNQEKLEGEKESENGLREEYEESVATLKDKAIDLESVKYDESDAGKMKEFLTKWETSQDSFKKTEESVIEKEGKVRASKRMLAHLETKFREKSGGLGPNEWLQPDSAKSGAKSQDRASNSGKFEKFLHEPKLSISLFGFASVLFFVFFIADLSSPLLYLPFLFAFFGRLFLSRRTRSEDIQVREDYVSEVVRGAYEEWQKSDGQLTTESIELESVKDKSHENKEDRDQKIGNASKFALKLNFEICEDLTEAKDICEAVREGVKCREKWMEAKKKVAEAEDAVSVSQEKWDDLKIASSCSDKEEIKTRFEKENDEKSSEDSSRDELNENITNLKLEIKKIQGKKEVSALKDELVSFKEQREALTLEAAANLIVKHVIKEAKEKHFNDKYPDFFPKVAEYFSEITKEEREVYQSETSFVNVTTEDGEVLKLEQLSTAARAQLYLAFRLAMADERNSLTGLKIPLICDDPLVHFDAKRAKRALKVLKEEVAKEKRQVILFTCHKRTYDHALKLGATTKELW